MNVCDNVKKKIHPNWTLVKTLKVNQQLSNTITLRREGVTSPIQVYAYVPPEWVVEMFTSIFQWVEIVKLWYINRLHFYKSMQLLYCQSKFWSMFDFFRLQAHIWMGYLKQNNVWIAIVVVMREYIIRVVGGSKLQRHRRV
jgi:hypothetical protein